jgi:hypothetical protein
MFIKSLLLSLPEETLLKSIAELNPDDYCRALITVISKMTAAERVSLANTLSKERKVEVLDWAEKQKPAVREAGSLKKKYDRDATGDY